MTIERETAGAPTRPAHQVHRAHPALSRCIAVAPAEFATWYWSVRPLHSPAADLPKGFDDLLSVADVDELVSRRGVRTPFLRVVNDGRVVPTQRFSGSGGAGAEVADQVVDDRVLELVMDGATLVLQGLHRLWPALIDFTVALRAELGHPVQVNAYLTPAGAQGLGAHYDTHDVFVLQVAGRKRWRVHRPVKGSPLESQPWGGQLDEVNATADGEPALDVTLEPGDSLYLPRGWLHSATALDERSLHLTVGIRPITRYAVLEALTTLAAEDEELRAALPMGVNIANPAELSVHLAETVAALGNWLGRAEPAGIATVLTERFWPASRPAPIRPLAQADAIASLAPDSRVTVRPGLQWRLVRHEPERVTLHLTDRALTFPRHCEPALRTVLSGSVERVGDLPGLPDDTDRLVLGRRLLREAVLVPAQAAR
ncbi:MAG TPA: cupin domain-containing protein [Micromonosporaceae bacterium]|nr:cupin domain-containing protein [Micromonosporaceae bacterium]